MSFWHIDARGCDELRGYVFRDGRMAEVTSVEEDFETNDECLQKRIAVNVEDTAGRSARVEGEHFTVFSFLPVPELHAERGRDERHDRRPAWCRLDGVHVADGVRQAHEKREADDTAVNRT